MWAVSDQGGLRRIDASTNSVTATAPVPKPLSWVAAGGGFAWTANETKGTVYKVDQTGEIVATYRTGDGARSVSFADGTLWGANSDAGTLSAIDAASGAVRTYRFGHPLGDAVAVGRYVLLYIGEGLTVEDRISALQGKVAKLVIPIFTLDPTDPRSPGSRSRSRSSAPPPPDCLRRWREPACGPSSPRRCRRSRRTGGPTRSSEARPSLLASVERTHHG